VLLALEACCQLNYGPHVHVFVLREFTLMMLAMMMTHLMTTL
jgi:hypothetical protein